MAAPAQPPRPAQSQRFMIPGPFGRIASDVGSSLAALSESPPGSLRQAFVLPGSLVVSEADGTRVPHAWIRRGWQIENKGTKLIPPPKGPEHVSVVVDRVPNGATAIVSLFGLAHESVFWTVCEVVRDIAAAAETERGPIPGESEAEEAGPQAGGELSPAPKPARQKAPGSLPVPGRPADFRRWCRVWQLVRSQVEKGYTATEIAAWLRMAQATEMAAWVKTTQQDRRTRPNLPHGEDTVRQIIAAGEATLLDRQPEPDR